jgi:choline transport protein
MIQGLLVLNDEHYTFERWHGTLIYWAILAWSAVVNIRGVRLFSLIENLSLVFHVGTFIIVLVVVCVVSPTKHKANFVFRDSINDSGWSNNGIAWCIGLLSSCYVLIGDPPSLPECTQDIFSPIVLAGYDGATHMSEEIQNPRVDVPIAMIGSILLNGTLGFGFLVAILFCMGDLKSALDTETGYPIIQIFYNITGSTQSASALCSTLIIMAGLAAIPLLASASRMLWVLARDNGETLNPVHQICNQFLY